MNNQKMPLVAIVTPNTLAGMGLASIIERMMPGVQTSRYDSIESLCNEDSGNFVHYFVSARLLMEKATYFLTAHRQHRTIVLCHGAQHLHLPQHFHTLDVSQPEEVLIRDILRLAASGHRGHHPQQPSTSIDSSRSTLTQRENEVLRLVVTGLLNKEIAEKLGISLTTVISHRKNLTEKLGIRSVSALTIYAVTHGIIRAEEI